MASIRASSSTSSDLAPGTVVAGFRVEHVLGRGSRGVVYEATQLGLDRRVALKLLPPDPELEARFRSLEWPEHPNVVRLYAAGSWEQGLYLATQLVRGTTLDALRGRRRHRALADTAAALDAAHAAGIVHGSVTARNVLVGRGARGYLSDFGLGPAGATVQSDRAALAALSAPTPRRWTFVPVVLVLAALAAVAAVLTGSHAKRPPPLLAGAQALGSALTPGSVDSVDCDGGAPNGGSPQCTLVQTRLPGRAVSPSRDGAIRRWTVRGARGRLALQVLRRRGRTFTAIARTPYVQIADGGLHTLPADLEVRAGDLVGLQVTPGAAVGVRRSAHGATTARSFEALTFDTRAVDHPEGTGFDYEVMLRVEYVPGARATPAGLLSGAAAARAPAGRRLGSRDVEVATGGVRTVAVVRLTRGIAVDLFDGTSRLARVPVAGANAGGRLLSLGTLGQPTVGLSWRNPDGATVEHDYAVTARSLAPSG
jgi:Protein tyrosine and serine/threonine kinase